MAKCSWKCSLWFQHAVRQKTSTPPLAEFGIKLLFMTLFQVCGPEVAKWLGSFIPPIKVHSVYFLNKTIRNVSISVLVVIIAQSYSCIKISFVLLLLHLFWNSNIQILNIQIKLLDITLYNNMKRLTGPVFPADYYVHKYEHHTGLNLTIHPQWL